MHIRFTQIKERVAAVLGDSLFAKALLYTVSVVKANHLEDRATKSCVRREITIVWLPTALFGKSICYLSVGLYVWKNDTATSEK